MLHTAACLSGYPHQIPAVVAAVVQALSGQGGGGTADEGTAGAVGQDDGDRFDVGSARHMVVVAGKALGDGQLDHPVGHAIHAQHRGVLGIGAGGEARIENPVAGSAAPGVGAHGGFGGPEAGTAGPAGDGDAAGRGAVRIPGADRDHLCLRRLHSRCRDGRALSRGRGGGAGRGRTGLGSARRHGRHGWRRAPTGDRGPGQGRGRPKCRRSPRPVRRQPRRR